MNRSLKLVELGPLPFVGAGLHRIEEDQPGPKAAEPENDPHKMKDNRKLEPKHRQSPSSAGDTTPPTVTWNMGRSLAHPPLTMLSLVAHVAYTEAQHTPPE